MTRKYFICILILIVQIYFLSQVTLRQNTLIDIINLSVSFSGIIFTINGVWIAVLFPQIFTKIYSPNQQLKDKEKFLEEAYSLLKPLIFGALSLVLSILFRVIIEIELPYLSSQEWFLSLRFPFVIFLLEFSLYNLFLALNPGFQTYLSAYKMIKKSHKKEKIFSNNQKGKQS